MLRYTRVGLDGLTPIFDISAPSHLSSPPLIPCAFFGVLVSNEAKLPDVQVADDNDVPKEDNNGVSSEKIGRSGLL